VAGGKKRAGEQAMRLGSHVKGPFGYGGTGSVQRKKKKRGQTGDNSGVGRVKDVVKKDKRAPGKGYAAEEGRRKGYWGKEGDGSVLNERRLVPKMNPSRQGAAKKLDQAA